MSKTVVVPDDVLERAMRAAGADSATDTVVMALEEFSQRHSQKSLIGILGTFDDIMTQEELEASRKVG